MTTTKSLQSEGKCGKMIAQAAIIGFYRNGPTYRAEPLPCKFHATKRAGFIGGSNKGECCKECRKIDDRHIPGRRGPTFNSKCINPTCPCHTKGEDGLSEVENEDLREPWVSVLGALIDVEQKIITPEIALDIIKKYITFHYE